MIPQTQRWFHGAVFDAAGRQTDEGGDCFAACLASMLEVAIEDFPNFLAGEREGDWYLRWQRWLYDEYRAELLYRESDWPDPRTQLAWWAGEVMLGKTPHSVVFYRDEFRWDPAPEPHKRVWSLGDVKSVVALFSIASILDRENGAPEQERR
jgi:hypothetical protein